MEKLWIFGVLAGANTILATAPLEERAALTDRNANVQLFVPGKVIVTHPTCLNPEVGGGYSLQETLEMVRNCLQGFMYTFRPEITQLDELGLFAGEVKQYNPDVVSVLYKIFTIVQDKPDNIVNDFNRWTKYLVADMEQLALLVKQKDTQESTIRDLLMQIQQPLLIARWCTNHYLNHRQTYLAQLGQQH